MIFLKHKLKINSTVIFILFVSVSLILSIISLLNNNFPFTMDQARDMLAIRQMAVFARPVLVGPTTSINGVFLGPLWYYFNLPAFIVSKGHPFSLVLWQLLAYHLSIIYFFVVIRKKTPYFAFISSLLLLFAPVFFYANRYSWNANAMPTFSLIFFTYFFKIKTEKISKKKLLILGLLAGAGLQIEAAFGILFPIFILFIFFSSFKKNLKKAISFLSGFFITLLPQVIFEFRHSFVMSKTLLSEFFGDSKILGDSITFSERIADRLQNYLYFLEKSLRLPRELTLFLFILSLAIILYALITKKISKTLRNYTLNTLIFIIFSFVFYLFYSNKLKGWFVITLSILYIFIFSASLSIAIKNKYNLITFIFILPLLWSVVHQTKVAYDHWPSANLNTQDRSQLKNELAVVNWVYADAKGRAFKVYNYLPSVYDFPYQYLFWWYGGTKYNYHPDTVSYLDNVPEYIKDNEKYYNKKKKVSSLDYPIYLIIEKDLDMPQREQNYLANFSHLCLRHTQTFPWTSYIKVLYNCKNELK